MCSPLGQPGCDAGQSVRSASWVPGPLVESRLSGSQALREALRCALKGAAQRGPQARAVEAAQSVEAQQGEARDRRQRGRQLAVHLSQQMDAAQHWDGSGMCGQVVWSCFGSCGLLGRGAYRSTAMVAVIKVKAFCYLQVLLSHLLWLLVRCVPCFRGA